MSLFLADSNGFVCDVSTAGGWQLVAREVRDRVRGTALGSLIETGQTGKPQEAATHLTTLLPFVKNTDAKKTLVALLDGLKKCKDTAIISQ